MSAASQGQYVLSCMLQRIVAVGTHIVTFLCVCMDSAVQVTKSDPCTNEILKIIFWTLERTLNSHYKDLSSHNGVCPVLPGEMRKKENRML